MRTRRDFLRGALAAAGTIGLGATVGNASSTGGRTRIRLGAPIFAKTNDPEAWARAHRALGYGAAYCPKLTSKEADQIRAYAAAAAKHDLIIAEVGRWVNLLDADPAKRAANLATVTDGLALAEAIGARCCVDIAGSHHPQKWFGPHPKNLSKEFFDAAVENARKIIDAVKPKRAKFCYEMMGWSIPHTADSYARLIKAIDRAGFGVHLDPCNAINSPEKLYANGALIRECFEKLGPWIASCHAKDVAWEVALQVHFKEVTIGAGEVDYAEYLRCLAALPREVPLMIEHMPNAEEYDKSRRRILEVGAACGVAFA